MGDRKPAAGAVNFTRRTWDRDEYERKAKERLEKDLSGEGAKDVKEPAVRGERGRIRHDDGGSSAYRV